MKKVIVLIVSLLMVSACAQDLGEQSLVCPDYISLSPRETWDGDDRIQLEPIYRDYTIKYVSDNKYITSVITHISFQYDGEIKAMVENVFNGDKQAWLDWLNKEEQSWLGENKIGELDGNIGVDNFRENPERPTGWRGLIVPDEHNFDKVRNEYLNFHLCEVE